MFILEIIPLNQSLITDFRVTAECLSTNYYKKKSESSDWKNILIDQLLPLDYVRKFDHHNISLAFYCTQPLRVRLLDNDVLKTEKVFLSCTDNNDVKMTTDP